MTYVKSYRKHPENLHYVMKNTFQPLLLDEQ